MQHDTKIGTKEGTITVVEPTVAARTRQRRAGETYARIVDDICGVLSARDVAHAVGVGERSVQNWRAGTTRPQGPAREALLDLYYLMTVLNDIYTPEGVEVWLRGRAKPFAGQRPLEVFASGERERVIALATQIRDY